MHRNSAILAPVASLETTASHTWVVRPRWTGVARQAIALSGKEMSFDDVTVSVRGAVIRTETIKVEPSPATAEVPRA